MRHSGRWPGICLLQFHFTLVTDSTQASLPAALQTSGHLINRTRLTSFRRCLLRGGDATVRSQVRFSATFASHNSDCLTAKLKYVSGSAQKKLTNYRQRGQRRRFAHRRTPIKTSSSSHPFFPFSVPLLTGLI
uniref:Putative secreted protein n=1 Tax=Anopheles darlingi TaxID=43151 RepID=A0A2M4D6N7_ANODA